MLHLCDSNIQRLNLIARDRLIGVSSIVKNSISARRGILISYLCEHRRTLYLGLSDVWIHLISRMTLAFLAHYADMAEPATVHRSRPRCLRCDFMRVPLTLLTLIQLDSLGIFWLHCLDANVRVPFKLTAIQVEVWSGWQLSGTLVLILSFAQRRLNYFSRSICHCGLFYSLGLWLVHNDIVYKRLEGLRKSLISTMLQLPVRKILMQSLKSQLPFILSFAKLWL